VSKPFIVEHAPLLSGLVLLLGCGMAVAALAMGLSASGAGGLRSYSILGISVGVLIALVGGLWFLSFLRKARKFHLLLGDRSKAVLLKNMDEIEYLAWLLPIKYENELLERKRELRLK
jgi:hypothetical protein